MQEIRSHLHIDLNYFKGNIALHNDDILHLINGHPEGVIISWNKKTFGKTTGSNAITIQIMECPLLIRI